jgi:flagellar hook-associated protein 1 FlgK
MGLGSALSIASGGLANINAQLALVSQNVANAGTPAYAVETGSQQEITANGVGMGVHTGPATRQINLALQASVIQQNATVSGLTTTQTALQAIDIVLGTPGQGSDLGSLLGVVQNQFSALLTNPSSQAQQSAVVSAASTLATGINSLSSAYTAQRQAAQDDLGSAVTTLNKTLAAIGQLSNQIIAMQPTGLSTADLENQRDAAVQTLSGLIDIKTIAQPNGDLSVFTPTGLSLPTRGTSNPFSIDSATALPGAYYGQPNGKLSGIMEGAANVAGVMTGGTDVTSAMTGGQIGADVTLRDTTLPTDQAELDEFSYGMSSRFSAQGLDLFTDPSGTVPVRTGSNTPPSQLGYVGYSATIQANPAIIANPSLVRDGTPGNGGGFTPNDPTNPTGGGAGYTELISNVLNYTFGSQTQSGGNAPQPAFNTTGLGASGTLSSPFSSATTLAGYASNMVSSQAQQSAATTGNLTTEQALQTSLTSKVAATSGVSMDTEMSLMITLQNAYGVNAKIISAIQSMFGQLLQAVQ